jgi:hypothetical protein
MDEISGFILLYPDLLDSYVGNNWSFSFTYLLSSTSLVKAKDSKKEEGDVAP